MTTPSNAWLVPPEYLSGEVVLSRGGGEVVARESLDASQSPARARLRDVPNDETFTIEVLWWVGELLVAHLATPQPLRVEAGRVMPLEISADMYSYPDADGDGAPNIVEVAAALSSQNTTADGAEDETVVPPGFHTGPVAALPLRAAALGTADVHLDGGERLAIVRRGDPSYSEPEYLLETLTPSTAARDNAPLECSDPAGDTKVLLAAAPTQETPGRVAVACGGAVHFFDVPTSGPPTAQGTTQLDHVVHSISFDTWSESLYASLPTAHAVAAMPADAAGGFDLIGQDILGAGSEPVQVLARKEDLVVVDKSRQALVVLGKGPSGLTPLGVALSGEVPEQATARAHPLAPRLYIADRGLGTVRIVNTEDAVPEGWAATIEARVGSNLVDLHVEAVTSVWLYGLGSAGVFRFGLLDAASEMIAEPGYRPWSGLALLNGGRQLALLGASDGSLLLLGHPRHELIEHEPNEFPNQLHEDNSLGQPPSLVVGFISEGETGTGGATLDPPTLQRHDVADLWRLDTTDLDGGRVAVALVPTSNRLSLGVALFDFANASPLGQSAWLLADAQPQVGTGALLVSPPLAELPDAIGVAVAAHRSPEGSVPVPTGTAYELQVAHVPASIALDEVEPNDGEANAQEGLDLPVQIEGDLQTDDDQDCFRVPVTTRRLGVILQPHPDIDADLMFYDDSGEPWSPGAPPGDGVGVTEHWVLDRSLQPLGASFFVCVASDTVSPPDGRSYALDILSLRRP